MFGHGNGNKQGDAAATASPSSGEARTPEPAPASEMQGSQPASAEASPSTQRKRGGLRGIFKHKDKSAPMGSPLAPQDGPAPPPGRDIARDTAGTPPAVAAQRPSKEDVALPEYGGLASDSQVGGAATLLRLLCGTAPHVLPCGKLPLTPCRAVPCPASWPTHAQASPATQQKKGKLRNIFGRKKNKDGEGHACAVVNLP